MAVTDPAMRTQPRIMGILNITPDSFSDGGDFLDTARAVTQARKMVEEGASIIDIGGESSRPGAEPVSVAEQLGRVIPVIETLRAELGSDIDLSIDARVSEVAEPAIAAGATMINDISAGSDPGMLRLAASRNVPIVLMHMQGSPETMQDEPRYDDVVNEVCTYLRERGRSAEAAGIPAHNVIIDPGIGFGKTKWHNLAILKRLDALCDLGYPVMLGTSRKRFMGAVCRETEFKQLVGATCATTTLGTLAGIDIFRVHDVRENRQAMEVALAALSVPSA